VELSEQVARMSAATCGITVGEPAPDVAALIRATLADRPSWWKVAPLLLLSILPLLLLAFLWFKLLPKWSYDYGFLLFFAAYGSFGALFGLAMNVRVAPIILLVASPATYAAALLLGTILAAAINFLIDRSISGNYYQFFLADESLLTKEALRQLLTWIFHGALMGIVIYIVDRRRPSPA
jgi:hypothetical protein